MRLGVEEALDLAPARVGRPGEPPRPRRARGLDETDEEVPAGRGTRPRLVAPADGREDADVIEDVFLHDELGHGALDLARAERLVRPAPRHEVLERRERQRREDEAQLALAEERAL